MYSARLGSWLSKLDVPQRALFSTPVRTAARTLETKVIGDAMQTCYGNLVANIKSGDTLTFNDTLWEPSSWPAEARGVGIMEAPRGGLAPSGREHRPGWLAHLAYLESGLGRTRPPPAR